MEEYKTFMSITNSNVADDVIEILDANKFAFKIQDTSKDFDPSFAINPAKNSILIMLKQIDFERASSVLEKKTSFNIDEIDSQHPLFSFNKDELKNVIKNYDEWHPLDVKLAKYLLEKENIIVSQNEINENQDLKKINQDNKDEKSDLLTLTMGYLLCLFGGLAGIGIAVFLMIGKRTLSDGSKKYIYNKSDRKHGMYMLLLGTLFFIIFILKYL